MAKTIEDLASLIASDLKAGKAIQPNEQRAVAALPQEYRQELTTVMYEKAVRLAKRTILREKLQELSTSKGFTNVVKAMFPDAVIVVSGNRIVIEV